MSIDTSNTNQLLNEIEVSKLLSVSRKTLQAWRWQKTNLPFVKLGSAVRYRLSDIEAYIEAATHPTQS